MIEGQFRMSKIKASRIPVLGNKLKSSLNRPALSSIAYTVSSLAARGVGFLLTPLFTRLYTPAQFGAFSMFQSYLSILFIVGSLEICSGVIIRLLISESKSKDTLIYSALRIMLLGSAAALAIFFILHSLFPEESFAGFGTALTVCTLCRCTVSIFVSNAKFHYRIGSVVAVSFIESTLPPLITLSLYRLFDIRGYALISVRVLVYSCVMLLIAVPVFLRIRAKARSGNAPCADERRALTKKILKTAAPMLPYYISMIVISQGDKVLIGRTLGEEALGGYGVAYSLGSALTMLTSGLLGVLMPWISRKLRDKKIAIARRVSKRLYCLSALVTLIILCLSPELLSILAPQSYGNTLILVFPIALSSPTLLLHSLSVTANLRYGISTGVILSGVIPALVFVLSGILTMPVYGVTATAVALPIAYLISFAISSINLKIKSGFSLLCVNDYLQITLFLMVFAGIIYSLSTYISARILIAALLSGALLLVLYKSKEFISESK